MTLLNDLKELETKYTKADKKRYKKEIRTLKKAQKEIKTLRNKLLEKQQIKLEV